jgi:hypothetical protein
MTLMIACALAVALTIAAPARAAIASNQKRVCVYSGHSLATLAAFDALVGRDVDCVMLFANSSATWADWESPWFLHATGVDDGWRSWATAPGADRELIISLNLFPSSENGADWRDAGARGDYEDHAQALARNLVAAGLGSSVIRLSPEMNGDWNSDSIGSSDSDYALWRRFWRNTVVAMRSVPGANFAFDWCINAAVRPIPLDSFYPGDDVVDIVGIDAYDSGVAAGLPRWATIYERSDGIQDAVDFARAHGKPLSIPEWGVAPTTTMLAGGDDPEYVDGIASVVRSNSVAYQSYFYRYDFATQLAGGPASLQAYRKHFGAGGDSAGPPTSAPPPDGADPPAPGGGSSGAQPAPPPPPASTPASGGSSTSKPVKTHHARHPKRHPRRRHPRHRHRHRRRHPAARHA